MATRRGGIMTVEIDGSIGEGGGQILRTAVALSCALEKDVVVKNIRKGRKTPGLRAQHFAGIRLATEMCDADVEGLEIGSTEVVFNPKSNTGGSFQIDIGTAGSISLVLQTCLLPAFLANGPTDLVISGGTDVPWSPPIDYLTMVLLPLVQKMGATAEITTKQRGFYPSGGGVVSVHVLPSGGFREIGLASKGNLLKIRGSVASRNLPAHIPDRIGAAAVKTLSRYDSPEIESDFSNGPSTGTSLVLSAEYENTFIGSSCLGEKGVPAEKVGELAALHLDEEMRSGATLDLHAVDQLIPFMFLAEGESVFKTADLSAHAKTNLRVSEQMVDRQAEIAEKNGITQVSIV